MAYIGETSTPLHLRINQHRSDSNNYNSSTNYNKSTIELKHFNLHNFKNTTIEILKIHKNIKQRHFLELSYMKYYNTVYPYGLNTDLFNKPVKSFSTLCIQNSNFKHFHDFNTIYSNFNSSLYNKTTRTKRGNSKNKLVISKNKILKEIKLLHEQYLLSYNWKLIRKFTFAVRKKDLATYLNIFMNNKYNLHFSDIFFDLLMYKIQLHNVDLQKTSKKDRNNSQLIINFSNQAFNKIIITKIISDKSCQFPLR